MAWNIWDNDNYIMQYLHFVNGFEYKYLAWIAKTNYSLVDQCKRQHKGNDLALVAETILSYMYLIANAIANGIPLSIVSGWSLIWTSAEITWCHLKWFEITSLWVASDADCGQYIAELKLIYSDLSKNLDHQTTMQPPLDKICNIRSSERHFITSVSKIGQ